MLGIIIIIFFALVAIFAPIIAPLDPLSPKMPGYYPASKPRIAHKLSVPIWYKSLLGMNYLSENVLIVEDHEFNSSEMFNKEWNPQYNATYVSLQYSTTGGSHDDDGCVEISYRRQEGEAVPAGGNVSVVLAKEFEFPYQDPPSSIWWHYSLRVENRTPVGKFPIRIVIKFRRGSEPYSYLVDQNRFSTTNIGSKWYSKSSQTIESGTIESTIFTGSGNYTFDFVVLITEQQAGSVDFDVYVDNVQVILYGEAYGLLGTTSIPRDTPRDIFTMLVHGTRVSFMIGILTAVFSVLIGLVVGLVAGYVRGMVDEALMRFADFLLVLPGLPLLIVLVTVLGRSIWNIIGVLVFMGWMGFSRSVRSMTLSLRERPFIESAKASGAGTGYIIYRHILPNVFALVYISLATSVPGAIISEASLAWLGLGDITISSWGVMLYDFSRTQTAIVKSIGSYWFWVVPPGVAIALMAMAFILMGFSLDEILNPRLRKRR